MDMEDLSDFAVRLLGAKEVGEILGVNATIIYKLWNDGKLDWWSINGTKKTTKAAIRDFLNKTRCVACP